MSKTEQILQYTVLDNGTFPNSILPVLHYKNVLDIPFLFPARYVEKIFRQNNWTNNWRNGIYTYNHYHSITHEAMGVYKGKTLLQLGGSQGLRVVIEKGDVLIIPAGVAHKNMGKENDVLCVGGYPDGRKYDMHYGGHGERPQTDANIAAVPKPSTDPVYGTTGGLNTMWK